MTPLTLVELAERLGTRELKAIEAVDGCLERIAQREPAIHAWTAIDADGAREQARTLDRQPMRGPLHGVPFAVKDIIDAAGFCTEHGSSIYAGRRADADAACVAAARRAGAIVIGKTVTTEFATFEPAATVNPRNPEHTPGGSSSGSAAAVADGMVPAALGTQTMGSIVRPASYCGIVGYKPSFATLARDGVKLVAPSLDTVGVFAATVRGAALFAGGIAGRADLLSLPRQAAPPRIAVCRTHAEASPEMLAAIDTAARALRAAGADVTELALPASFATLPGANETIYGYELARALAFERREHGAALSPALRAAIDAGSRIAADRYAEALAKARACRRALADAMQAFDVLLTPSATGEAPAGLASTGSPVMNRPWTLLHVPVVNVPFGSGRRGLPLGLQIVGHLGGDARALAAAEWIEARLPAG